MQPTNTDVDYEKALQNYFHYDMGQIYSDACTIHQEMHNTRTYGHGIIVHNFVMKIIGDDKRAEHEHHRSLSVPITSHDAARIIQHARRLQEYLHDWNDVVDTGNNEKYTLEGMFDDPTIEDAVFAIDKIVEEVDRDLERTMSNDVHGMTSGQYMGYQQKI